MTDQIKRHTLLIPNRRQLLSGMAALGAAATLPVRGAFAQKRITITEGNVAPLPIAIPDFVAGSPADAEVGTGVSQVITNNLRRSGLFAPIDQAAFIEKIVNIDTAPQFQSWKTINAQALVTGRMTRQGDGRLKAEFRLWDVASGQQLAGQQYFTSPEYWRRIAHIISDQIYERLTGEKGYFDSRVVFVDESGPTERRVKRLALMDQDGANVRYLTRGSDLVLTPRFSPSTQEITYMEFGQGDPKVYLLNIETGQTRDRRQFPGHVVLAALLAGRPARDHESAAGRQFQPVRDGPALEIDHAPDRHAGDRHLAVLFARRQPHLLRIRSWRQAADLCDGGDRRARAAHLLQQGRRQRSYSTPVWSPRGDYIAFTKQGGGQFSIGIMKPDGSGERILTSGFHNEGPTFAPNGRVLMFFRDPGGNGGPSLFTVDITGRNELKVPTPGFASDPAWSPLLS